MVIVLVSVLLSTAISTVIAVGVKRQTIKFVEEACNINIAEVNKIKTVTLDAVNNLTDKVTRYKSE